LAHTVFDTKIRVVTVMVTYDILIDSSYRMTAPGVSTPQSIKVQLEGVLEFRTLRAGEVDAGRNQR
jgi:hypothetical protein